MAVTTTISTPSTDPGILASRAEQQTGETAGGGGLLDIGFPLKIRTGSYVRPSFSVVVQDARNKSFKCVDPKVVALEWTDPGNWKALKKNGEDNVGVTGSRELDVPESTFQMGDEVWLTATRDSKTGRWSDASLSKQRSSDDSEFSLHIATISQNGIKQFHVGTVLLQEPPETDDSSGSEGSSGGESEKPSEGEGSGGEGSGGEGTASNTVVTDIKDFSLTCEGGKFKLKWRVVRKKIEGALELGDSESSECEASLGEGDDIVVDVKYENDAFRKFKKKGFFCGDQSESEIVQTVAISSEVCG